MGGRGREKRRERERARTKEGEKENGRQGGGQLKDRQEEGRCVCSNPTPAHKGRQTDRQAGRQAGRQARARTHTHLPTTRHLSHGSPSKPFPLPQHRPHQKPHCLTRSPRPGTSSRQHRLQHATCRKNSARTISTVSHFCRVECGAQPARHEFPEAGLIQLSSHLSTSCAASSSPAAAWRCRCVWGVTR